MGLPGPQGPTGPTGPQGAGFSPDYGTKTYSEIASDPTGGNDFAEIDCPAGQIAVGIQGKVGQDNNQFGLVCAPISSFSNDIAGVHAVTGSTSNTPTVGNLGGGSNLDYSRICPAGYAMIGAHGSIDSSFITPLLVHCEQIGGGPLYDTTLANGTPVPGTNVDLRCPGGGVVTGFQGRAGDVLDQVQFICH